jgi:16S rRNA (cytosine(967)-C(5))-methyltransferase
MNQRALLQLGSELLFTFRHGSQPADLAFSSYVRDRRFLGANDKRYLGDWFYHALRHLRRYDEAIQSAFDGFPMARENFRAGFPVTSESGQRAWARDTTESREGLNQDYASRSTDSLRLALAALELKQIEIADVAQELEKAWPHKKPAKDAPPPPPGARTPRPVPSIETITRLLERAVEVSEKFRNDARPSHQARRWSWPDWLWAQLTVNRTEGELDQLGAALLTQAGLTLRINTLHTTRPEAEEAYNRARLAYRLSNIVPEALILEKRLPHGEIPGMDSGLVEVQDEGSQAVARYCGVEPDMRVADACAGAGGKALHLAALMHNTGTIHAFDIEPGRLANLSRRAERLGVINIDLSLKLSAIGTLPLREQLDMLDLVLVDAPCSGTGTVRRQPEIRWGLSPTLLAQYRQTQATLLDRWADRVAVGGHLVYATCSLLAAENELQVDEFLARHPGYARAGAPPGFPPSALSPKGDLALSPHQHGCDGFFASRLIRNR